MIPRITHCWVPARRTGWLGFAVLLAGAALPGVHAAAQGPATRLALVVGEAAYTGLPPLPGCIAAAGAVAERLRHLGFTVTERDDASNGALGAALDGLARGAAAAPGSVIFFCGYAARFEDRLFLLPVTAAIDRPADLLTQGIAARSLTEITGRSSQAGLTVLDSFAPPPEAAALAAPDLPGFAAGLALHDGQALIGAVENGPAPNTAPPLAQEFAAALATPPVPLDALAERLRTRLAGRVAAFAAAGASPTLLVPPPAAAPPAQAVPPAPPPQPPPAAAAPVQVAPPAPSPAFPDEADYDDRTRRRVQKTLRDLGLYNGAVNGLFGSDTRAAIRRFQHEIGAPETGRLSPADAALLLAD